MWRAVILLSLFTANLRQSSASEIGNGFFTEGGNYRNPQRPLANGLPSANYAARQSYYGEPVVDDDQQQPPLEQQIRYQYEKQHPKAQQQQKARWPENQDGYLEKIMEQLRSQRNTRLHDAPVAYQRADEDYTAAAAAAAAASNAQRSEEPSNEDETLAELEELQRFTEKIHRLERGSSSEASDASPELQSADPNGKAAAELQVNWPTSERPLSAQKKGQSEFVEFVEPRVNKALNGIEFIEKRVPLDAQARTSRSRGGFGFLSANGNVVFLAFVAMCCVVAVVGVVGGTYYYYHVRTAREDPFDDFTRYSPAGPGRDRFKKCGGGSPLGARTGEKGDDVLAYKAQLHHYQQTKQKIIGGDGGAVVGGGGPGAIGGGDGINAPGADVTDHSDDEDDGADLEHNISVYEWCSPGLAPTGDIEVQNPNFIEMAPK